MSEANNAWRVTVDGTEHDVELEHSTMTGKMIVKVDGEVIGEDRMLFKRKQFEFDLAGRPARVSLDFKYGGLSQDSALHVDGRYVEPLRR
jgi:hypothetical protein